VFRHASFIHRRPLPLHGAWVFLASACPAPHGLPQGSGLGPFYTPSTRLNLVSSDCLCRVGSACSRLLG